MYTFIDQSVVLHELSRAHCRRDKYCRQGKTNFKVGTFCFVNKIA